MKKSRIVFGIWTFLILLLYLLSGAVTALLLFLFLLALALWCACGTAGMKNKLVCRFQIQEMAEKGREAEGILEVHNRSLFPAGNVRVELEFHNLLTGECKREELRCSAGAGQRESVRWKMVSGNCGNIRVKVRRITAYDFLGLFQTAGAMEGKSSVTVLPDIKEIAVEVSEGMTVNWESMRYSDLKRGDDPSEIFGIRAYEEGDSPKHIHWKLSQKMGELYVKELSLPTDNAILLFFETARVGGEEADPGRQAALMEAFLSVSQQLAQKGYVHALGWYDQKQERLCMEQVESEDDLAQMMRGLLSLERREKSFTGLHEYIEKYQENPFSHVVYFTAEEAGEECRGLSEISCFSVVQQSEALERMII